jgi:hypothetical protein
VRFKRNDLTQPAKMPLGSAELGAQQRIDEISRHSRAHNPAAHTDDVQIVVFNSCPLDSVRRIRVSEFECVYR